VPKHVSPRMPLQTGTQTNASTLCVSRLHTSKRKLTIPGVVHKEERVKDTSFSSLQLTRNIKHTQAHLHMHTHTHTHTDTHTQTQTHTHTSTHERFGMSPFFRAARNSSIMLRSCREACMRVCVCSIVLRPFMHWEACMCAPSHCDFAGKPTCV